VTTRKAALAAWLIALALPVVLAGHAGASSAASEPLRFLGGKRPAARTAPVPTQWCGGAATAAEDRQPDAVSGRQAHVIYAIPADGVDRFPQLASAIASDIASSDAWWRREDPARTLRFDLFAFPGCPTTFGQLDISRVQLSQPASAFAEAGRADLVAEAVFNTGLDDSYKKYIVLYDGAVDAPDICGASFIAPTESAYSVIYLQASICPNDTGAGAFTASVIVHEYAHNLGAVPFAAPHICPDGTAHVCDTGDDLLFPASHGQGIDELRLDIGRDDYYGHGGGWFDLQDSPWLERLDVPDFPLSVTIEGTGVVVSDLPGITCPTACSIAWDGGTVVRLAARPIGTAVFRGWRGACAGLGVCTLTMDAAKAATARFAVPLRLSVRVVGRGRVVSLPAGISCPAACAGTFDSGTRVTLRATARPGWRFAGWTGGCRGVRACVLTLARASSVVATFRRR
jgi:hypothetical protein